MTNEFKVKTFNMFTITNSKYPIAHYTRGLKFIFGLKHYNIGFAFEDFGLRILLLFWHIGIHYKTKGA